mgnify:CR=1 FL=1
MDRESVEGNFIKKESEVQAFLTKLVEAININNELVDDVAKKFEDVLVPEIEGKEIQGTNSVPEQIKSPLSSILNDYTLRILSTNKRLHSILSRIAI